MKNVKRKRQKTKIQIAVALLCVALLVLPLVLVRLCLLSTLRTSWGFFCFFFYPLATRQLPWDLGDNTKSIAIALEENYLHNNPPHRYRLHGNHKINKHVEDHELRKKTRQGQHKRRDASSTPAFGLLLHWHLVSRAAAAEPRRFQIWNLANSILKSSNIKCFYLVLRNQSAKQQEAAAASRCEESWNMRKRSCR